MGTMTKMEQFALTSLQLCLAMYRTTSTNIPKMRNCHIAFPLTKPARMDVVPWSHNPSLPLVLIESDNKCFEKYMDLEINMKRIKECT